MALETSDWRDEREWLIETTDRLNIVRRAVKAGAFSWPKEMDKIVCEVMQLELSPGALIDPEMLSTDAIGFVRTSGAMLRFSGKKNAAERASIGREESQALLFKHFAEIFTSVVGYEHDAFGSVDEVARVVRDRAKIRAGDMLNAYSKACDELARFYEQHSFAIWTHARELGGMKLVLGGQRLFGASAFSGVQKMALYTDTQLIADPVFPFFESELDLQRRHVDLLTQIYKLLKLTPLVDANLPVPPIFIFPSFEKSLEKDDFRTQYGIHELTANVIGHACGVPLRTVDDVRDFVQTESERFVDEVMKRQLFIAPGAKVGELTNPREAVEQYLTGISQSRSKATVDTYKSLPMEQLLLIGISERLGPQFHLLENASELVAQPMLTQDVHWHYFSLAANSIASDLQQQNILSQETVAILTALHDEKLAWLSNVPVPILAELLVNQENLAFRKAIDEQTKILASAGVDDIDRVTKEVCHAIDSMVQGHQKVIGEIERKYRDKFDAYTVAGGFAVAVGVAAQFMPMLAGFGLSTPMVAAAGAVGKVLFDRVKKGQEVRNARLNLLGVLASTRRS